MQTFERLESNVRIYSRHWPTVFDTALGAVQIDVDGREFLDFFAGAGALNYGHNPPELRDQLVQYIASGGVTHSLDMATRAKEDFLLALDELVLAPRDMDYKVLFPGPTGTNAVEAALKIARKVTGRESVISFTNAFHGMTLGSLAVTGNARKRSGAGVPLNHAITMPFEDVYGGSVDTIDLLDAMLSDGGSGVDLPAAVIVETIQAEGGINVASAGWMRRLGQLCRGHGILLIVDDIQVGCGRTGPFFSFDEMMLDQPPDIVCLSKSLSGYGLPFAIVLVDPRWDVFTPGEHNGTFRGHNLAAITATAALRTWWSDDQLSKQVARHARTITEHLDQLVVSAPDAFHERRGRGLIQGLRCVDPKIGPAISSACFERGLLVETAGASDEVVKLLPPLTISDEQLRDGLHRLRSAVAGVLDGMSDRVSPIDRPVFDGAPT